MLDSNNPIRLWWFFYKYFAGNIYLYATGRFELQGRNSFATVMNHKTDISEYASFLWFQWSWFYDKSLKSK